MTKINLKGRRTGQTYAQAEEAKIHLESGKSVISLGNEEPKRLVEILAHIGTPVSIKPYFSKARPEIIYDEWGDPCDMEMVEKQIGFELIKK